MTDHVGHLLYGEITESYAGTAYLHEDGIGRTTTSEESTNETFDVEGCHTCNVEFETEGDGQ